MLTANDLEPHRPALMGHCYRMLGSLAEADDAVQETMIRAWKGLDRFEGRASLRTWLYRIASRVCLDALQDRGRRQRPMDTWPAGTIEDDLTTMPASHWVEPIPDSAALPADADPSQLVLLRESIRLAFVAALQYLPPRQRAVLLLVEVLGWSAAETAAGLDMSVAAVNSALQRARATLAQRGQTLPSGALTSDEASLVDRYVDAFQRYDIDALTALLHEDATFSMPPFALWLRGHDAIRGWLLGRGSGCRGSRLVPTAACGVPAFGQYRRAPDGNGHRPFALLVLESNGSAITGINSFLDTATLFPRFGLPPSLGGQTADDFSSS
jgi:RNA polymerase sigma-70 factor (ECF subfamily)